MTVNVSEFDTAFCVIFTLPLLFFFFQIKDLIADCFVTGKWDENKDAETLLQKDGK